MPAAIERITEQEQNAIHIHARTLAAAYIASVATFDEHDVAHEALELFRATRAAVQAHNEQVERVEGALGRAVPV